MNVPGDAGCLKCGINLVQFIAIIRFAAGNFRVFLVASLVTMIGLWLWFLHLIPQAKSLLSSH